MKIRRYKSSDCEEIVALFFDTIHGVNTKDYSEEQVHAWAGKTLLDIDNGKWNSTLSESYTLVAKKNGTIVGFGNITDEGYLDRLYVHKDYQRMGIAEKLLNQLEDYARACGVSELESDVSVTARPFFEKNGFVVVAQQKQERNNVFLRNYKMKKKLV